MKYLANVWRILALACVLGLAGCNSTQTPTYPAQLQMIIAQSAATESATTAGGSLQQNSPKAISVEQLLATVRAPKNREANTEQKVIKGRDSVPDWIFKGESRHQQGVVAGFEGKSANSNANSHDALAQAKALTQAERLLKKASVPPTPKTSKQVNQQSVNHGLDAINPNQRQLQLQYQANDLLPHQMQLLMAKQMVALQQMTLVKLVIGTSNESSSFARAATASRRAKQLIEQIGQQLDDPRSITVEYLPKIGDNIAIVTFQPRGS